MTGDSLTPEQPPSEPLYARESASGPVSGAPRGSGGSSGPQAGTDGFVPGWAPHMDAYAKSRPTPAPAADPLRDQIAAAIRPTMLIGLQDAELDGPSGTQRINEWVDWIADAVLAVPAIRDMQAELAALRAVARGYCPRCGRGDCAPTIDHWQRERQRAEKAEATVERVRDACDRIEAAVRANPTSPNFDGAYLAGIGHIRRALDPQEQP